MNIKILLDSMKTLTDAKYCTERLIRILFLFPSLVCPPSLDAKKFHVIAGFWN